MQRLLDIMARLRDPELGCPWDKEQDFKSIAPYTIEEAYEVVDAIERGDMRDLREELGDLLLQTVFHSQMAAEQGAFSFEDIAQAICDKLVRRHPHVFEGVQYETVEAQKAAWAAMKAEERAAKGKPEQPLSALDDIPNALPALLRAQKLHERATRAGFDWKDNDEVLAKLQEEIGELREALQGKDTAHQREELGDVLFCVAALAHKMDVVAEDALRSANNKFTRRFRHVEHLLKEQQQTFSDVSRETLEDYWIKAKQHD